MADLPRDDLHTDCAPVMRRNEEPRVPPYHGVDKRFASLDEQIDSGLGSIGSMRSSEFSGSYFPSLESSKSFDTGKPTTLHTQHHRQTHDNFSSRTKSTSSNDNLHHQLRNLSIGDSKNYLKSDARCDSGFSDGGYSSYNSAEFQPLQALPELPLFPTEQEDNYFSAQELDELFSQDEDGDTDLHMTIIHLLPHISLRIIAMAPQPALLNLPNTLHQTPLHLAVATRQPQVVRTLMAAGADLAAPDHLGNTALHVACRDGMLDMAQLLLDPVSPREMMAGQYRLSPPRVPQDLATRNYEGLTCAHLALQSGHLEVLRLLLSRGADVNEVDGKSGRTLLHMAADAGHQAALALLRQHPALDINAVTYAGLTPIALAHGRKLSGVVAWLARQGADTAQLTDTPGDSTDEEMNESVYDDICIAGQPVQFK